MDLRQVQERDRLIVERTRMQFRDCLREYNDTQILLALERLKGDRGEVNHNDFILCDYLAGVKFQHDG
jgi:hypothetical protein